MIKVIIFILFMIFAPAKITLNQTQHIKPVNNAVLEVGYEFNTLYPRASFSGTSSSFNNLPNNILISFNEGSVLQIDNENGQVQLNIKSTDGTITNIANYTYNTNYTYTYSQTDYKGILFGEGYTTASITSNGTTYEYTYFLQENPSNEISNFTKLYLISDTQATDVAQYTAGQRDGYNEGYTAGISTGQQEVLNNLDDYSLYTNTQYTSYGTTKYNEGYTTGISDATENDFTLLGLISAVMTAPALFVKEAFNFEFFGINLANLITFLLTISIVIFIIGLFRKK